MLEYPHSQEHEEALLSCCYIDPDVSGREAWDLFQDVNPFYLPETSSLWTALQAMGLDKFDPITASDYCGHMSFDQVRTILNKCVSIANFRVHLKWVQKLHVQRQLLSQLDDTSRQLFVKNADVDQVVDGMRNSLNGVMLSQSDSFRNSESMVVDMLTRAKEGKLGGLYTNHWRLDRVIAPMPPGSCITIAGYTGQGKTTLFNSLQLYMAQKGCGSALFSMEMPTAQVCWRMVAALGRFDSRPQALVDLARDPRVEQMAQTFASMPIHCKDTSSMTIREIKREIRALHSKLGIKVFGVDHIGLVKQVDNKLSREQHIAEVTRVLKETAMEIDGWVFPISQLNRDSQRGSGGPQLHHLRDSGAIEQDSDLVVFVHDPNSHEDSLRACRAKESLDVNLIVAKNRHGGTGRLVVPFAKWCSLFPNDITPEE